ncbi:MAG TPA: HAD-IA family hydrolase [Candidatus Acidoferrales bacterium]|nr:HAD-IA family hydrolase [Candidatus Acidoferrales bacterium]
MAEVTTLFWDNGGVILTNGWDRRSRQKAVEKFGLDWADFEDRHELMLHAFECGEATLDEYIQRTVFYRGRAFTQQQFKQFMFEQSQALPEALAFAKKLAATKRQLNAALNNESLEINDYRIKTFGLRDCFEAFFSSCYLGVRKPDRGIFTLALKITQRDAAECVMIDDRGLNLECAREMGMKTILVKDLAQLRADLAKLGVTAD